MTSAKKKRERDVPSPYIARGVGEIFLTRIPWLLLLMLSATFTGMIISAFESALSTSVYLTAFIPMLMGTGGNAGSQASVTVIRALSLGEICPADLFRIIKKEVRVALLCALTLSVIAYGKIYFLDYLLLGSLAPENATHAALTVSVSLFFTVIAANVIGALLPILARKLRLDPAVMASPFITTAVDTVSIALYFQIARIVIF